jgi:hypothetical protein
MKRLYLVFVVLVLSSSLGFASAESDLKILVSKMQTAILTQDKSAYLELVDLSDPIFKIEHQRFIDDWMQILVKKLELDMELLEENENDARGLLTWKYQNKDGDVLTSSYRAVFHKMQNTWRYAGESWQRVQAQNVDVLFMIGLEGQAQQVLELLPDITKHVADNLEFESQKPITVKMYDSDETVTQSVGLSWTLFGGWNEPDEAIKISGYTGATISSSLLAHEITHNYAFEHFGSHSFPWWLDEGLAEFVASRYWTASKLNKKLSTVSNWAIFNMLEPWDNISDLNATPTPLWDFVYLQGFAFVQYLSTAYGQSTRNRWLSEISSGKNLTQAAEIAFGASFDQINQDFRSWLKQRVATSSQSVDFENYRSSFGTSFIQRFSPSPTAHCAMMTASLGFNWVLEIFPTLGLPPQTL